MHVNFTRHFSAGIPLIMFALPLQFHINHNNATEVLNPVTVYLLSFLQSLIYTVNEPQNLA